MAIHHVIQILITYLTIQSSRSRSPPSNSIGHALIIENREIAPNLTEFENEIDHLDDIILVQITNSQISDVSTLSWLCDLGDTLHSLNLSNNLLSDLPTCIANLTELRELDVSKNYLQNIDENVFELENLIRVNVAVNRIKDFDIGTWALINSSNIEALNLSTNHLNSFPSTIVDLPFPNLESLDISNNNLGCNCHERWLLTWLEDLQHKIPNREQIMCLNHATKIPKPILELQPHEFHCKYPNIWKDDRTLVVLIFSLIVLITLLPVILSAILYCIWKKRLSIFKKTRWHPFDEDNCEKEDTHFDAFVSCAPQDTEWCENKVIDFLQDRSYKVLNQEDPTDTSNSRSNDAATSIRESRRTICILSAAYVDNNNCMLVLEAALARDIRRKTRRTILVKLDDVDICDVMVNVKRFPRKVTWLTAGLRGFYEELLYWLPTKTLDGKARDFDVVVRDDIPLEEVE